MSNPKLRFKREDGTNYPDWEEFKMSDIFTEIIEKNRPDLPVLSILQGQGTVYRDSSDRNIMYDKKSTTNYKAMKKGDFIIHLRTFEGGLECATLDGISSPAYKILRTNKLVSNAYKDYFRLRSFIAGRLAISVTGVRDGKNIEMSTFWNISVPVPCLEEQQKIADFLSSVDEVIAQSEAEVSNLQQQKKAAMQKIFSQEVRFKREDGTEFPEWETDAVGNRIKIYDEKVTSDCSLPILTSSKTNGIEYQADHFGREQNHDIDGYNILPLGYATYRNRSDNRDFTFNINEVCDKGIISKFYPVFTSNNCNLKFLIYLLNNSPSVIKEIGYTAIGTGQKVLSINDFRNIKIQLPCIEEQQKIAYFLSAYDTAIGYAKQELDKWKELKKGLLQQMFV